MNAFIQASDTKSFLHCRKQFWFDHQDTGVKAEEDDFHKHLAKKGNEHELKVLASLGKRTKATSPEHTQELMKKKVPVIYQPQFVDNDKQVSGKPDFLIITPEGEYQVGDAKLSLALNDRSDIKLQLGICRMLSGTTLPAKVFLRSGKTETVGDEYNDKVSNTLTEMRNTLESDSPPKRHYSHSACSICTYNKVCKPEFEKKSDLTLVFDLTGSIATTLKAQGISTIDQLATMDPNKIEDGPYLRKQDLKRNLVLQGKSQLSGEIIEKELLVVPSGTWVHFDVESHSISETAPTVVYLWGFLPPPYTKESMDYIWSDDDPENDIIAWNQVLKLIEHYREEYPDFRLVHFSSYEIERIKDYAARYNMMNHPTVMWLLGEDSPLLDLHPLVKNSLVLPLPKYGLKEICKDERLVNFQWELEESGSQWSVVRYMDYLDTTSSEEREAIKNEIVTYNRDDILATRAIQTWLEKAPWRSGGR